MQKAMLVVIKNLILPLGGAIGNSLAPSILLGGVVLGFVEWGPGVLPLRATAGKRRRNRSRTQQMTKWRALLYRRSFCSFPATERGRAAPTTPPVRRRASGGRSRCQGVPGGPGALGTEPALAKPEQPLPGLLLPPEWRGGMGWWTHRKKKTTQYIYIYLPSM